MIAGFVCLCSIDYLLSLFAHARQVHIKSAKGLPRALSHFVFCEYCFWNEPQPTTVPPSIGKDRFLEPEIGSGSSFYFEHKKVKMYQLMKCFVTSSAEQKII